MPDTWLTFSEHLENEVNLLHWVLFVCALAGGDGSGDWVLALPVEISDFGRIIMIPMLQVYL